MMPLGMAQVGETNIIRKITGRDEVRQHLAEIGFVVGEEVRVKDSRVALDKSMAMRILV